MHVTQVPSDLGLSPWLHLYEVSIEDSVRTCIRNMRAAQGALGTWPLYSREPLESVGLLLANNPILGILLPVSLGKGKHILQGNPGLWGWFCPGHGAVWGATTWTEPLSFPLGATASAPHGDLLFLLDSSASVSHYEFSRVREFVGQLVSAMPFGPEAVRASLVHVGSQPYTEFTFDQYSSGQAVQDAIRVASQRMGDTNTGLALAYAKEQLFAEEAGARLGVPKVLVWVTDGGSSDPVGPPMQELKDLGVTVFIVSTGRGNLLELLAAASAPAEKHLHFVDVDDLHIIAPELQDSITGRWEEPGPVNP